MADVITLYTGLRPSGPPIKLVIDPPVEEPAASPFEAAVATIAIGTLALLLWVGLVWIPPAVVRGFETAIRWVGL